MEAGFGRIATVGGHSGACRGRRLARVRRLIADVLDTEQPDRVGAVVGRRVTVCEIAHDLVKMAFAVAGNTRERATVAWGAA